MLIADTISSTPNHLIRASSIFTDNGEKIIRGRKSKKKMKKNHYDILGVDTSFTRDLLRAAYHSRLFESHPDKNITPHTTKTKQEEKNDLNENLNTSKQNLTLPTKIFATVEDIKIAYSILSDPEKRAAYDQELAESCARNGFNVTGAGLDEYTLNDFVYTDINGEATWTRNCPRCTSEGAMVLKEEDLEEGSPDGTGGFHIAVSCQICSLWIMVSYEEEGAE